MRSQIIFIALVFVAGLYGQTPITVENSNQNFFQFTYEPHYTDTSVVQIEGKNYFSVRFTEAEYPNVFEKAGSALLPYGKITIGVPSLNGSTVEVLSASYKEFEGSILPTPTAIKTDKGVEYKYVKSESYYNATEELLITPSERGISRGLNVETFLINPVQYFPERNVIRIYTSIRARITYPQGNSTSKTTLEDSFLKHAVLNFENAKYWGVVSQNSNKPAAVVSSVLATGTWYKFEAPTEGMYKITKSMLAGMGINAESVDPRTIKIYNNGGTMLPEPVGSTRPTDLVENAIKIVGEEDGRFDDTDYIIFYGRGTTVFEGNNQKVLARRKNVYSDKNFYFITSGGAQGKRMALLANSTNAGVVRNYTDAIQYNDLDKLNLYGSGRLFVGDELNQSVKKRSYAFDLKNVVLGSNASIRYQVVNASYDDVTMHLQEKDTTIASNIIFGLGRFSYYSGYLASGSVNRKMWSEQSSVAVSIPTNISNLKFYIDFLEVLYQRYLRPTNDQIVFYAPQNDSTYEFRIEGFTTATSRINVFDVSDYSAVAQIESPILGTPANSYYLKQQGSPQRIKRYAAASLDALLSPVNVTKIENQNLRGIEQGAEMILITRSDFLPEAERYKKYRETQSPDKRTVEIFTTDKIYNEFSGGNLDITGIRDFVGYAYNNWKTKPKFVFMFGGATYDFKDIEGAGSNVVPAYQTDESLKEPNSISTDDYFVAVDGNDMFVDLSVGRLPGRTTAEISVMVDKIVEYENSTDKGDWRNTFTLVADDQIVPSGYDGAGQHLEQSESLYERYIPKNFTTNKLYLARYPAVQTSFGRRKPDVNKALIQALNNGTLIVNYMGHGSPSLWADEQVFVQSTTIPALSSSRYFFLSTFTCDFGFYDRVNLRSATEELMFTKGGGAVAAYTSSRLSYSGENEALMYAFYGAAFNTPRDSLGRPITLGEVGFLAKYDDTSLNTQKYYLFGDPAMRLAMPRYGTEFSSINGTPLATDVQLKALSTVELRGVLRDAKGVQLIDFNGEGIVSVYDSERNIVLTEQYSAGKTIKEQGGLLFRGRISVVGGEFSSSFVVPKDISYENKKGKIVIYFFNATSDGIGFTDKIIVGGTDTTVQNDGRGPQITVAFDALENENAYLVQPNSVLKVKLEDATGLNATGTGIGHNIQAVLNDETTSPIDLTKYFTGDLNSGGKSGIVNYQFVELSEGEYKIEVSAFDVFNNTSSEVSFFKVVSDNDLTVEFVMNYPNPFAGSTEFTFQHNSGSPVDVMVHVYTIAGRKIKELEQKGISDRFVRIPWDGRDADGDILANGTYLYKLVVKSNNGEFTKSILGSAVIMR